MLSEEVVQQVAKLARLSLTSQECAEFAKQLSSVLAHFDHVSKINTDGVEPLVSPTDMEQFWREDIAQTWADPETALANAPERMGQLFKVPPVVG
jgi:aspartyl-tRNA(Asn)/glutamyl-tRNA(Gln) amidotransferase subunit C